MACWLHPLRGFALDEEKERRCVGSAGDAVYIGTIRDFYAEKIKGFVKYGHFIKFSRELQETDLLQQQTRLNRYSLAMLSRLP